MHKLHLFIILAALALALALVAPACDRGDGESCDCCDDTNDCKRGYKCVDLQGGTGKVCSSSSYTICSHGC